MNKQRLQNAIRALREGEDENFDMRLYAHPCGSPACVLGHYAARKDLQQEFFVELPGGVASLDSNIQPKHHTPEGDYMGVFHAVANHFDITVQETIDLFSGDGCGAHWNEEHNKYIFATKETAIAYMEDFIARHEVEEVIEELVAPTLEEAVA